MKENSYLYMHYYEDTAKKGYVFSWFYKNCFEKAFYLYVRSDLNVKNIISKRLWDYVYYVSAEEENILLEDYPNVVDCLKRTTSMEPRATNFFIKEDKKDEFKELFNKYFGNYYDLYSIDEVIESKLFGDGEENPIYRDLLGDFLAIAKTEKTLIYGNQMFKSHHAGYTEDEIMIPLIVFKTEKE